MKVTTITHTGRGYSVKCVVDGAARSVEVFTDTSGSYAEPWVSLGLSRLNSEALRNLLGSLGAPGALDAFWRNYSVGV